MTNEERPFLHSSFVTRHSSLAHKRLVEFSNELAAMRVLDPACGSGNFLYVALRRLLDLQKEVIAYAARRGLPEIPLTVGPHQLYGLEINEYAHELAQVTVWIGYLQWRHENGFGEMADPVLRPLGNIRRMDAILAYDAEGRPVEPEWPEAEVIIGNPPFLGGKRLRSELGDAYVGDIFRVYNNRVPREADLVTYWFEKARAQIERGDAQRAGLLATNSIRGGANRKILERIKATGDIFMAWSDNPWILDGAAVRVSMIGYDGEQTERRVLDGRIVLGINSDLTASSDLTNAKPLAENQSIAFMGDTKGGAFDIEGSIAHRMLSDTSNNDGLSNSDVVKPWVNSSHRILQAATAECGSLTLER
jgi:type II restriction/modification system DNA methylase subunit YeeA